MIPYQLYTLVDGGSNSETTSNNNGILGNTGGGAQSITTPITNIQKWGAGKTSISNFLGLDYNQISFLNNTEQNQLRSQMLLFLSNNGINDVFANPSMETLSPEVKSLGQWIVNYAMKHSDFINSEYIDIFLNSEIEFQQWTKNFLSQNPNVTWAEFQDKYINIDITQPDAFENINWLTDHINDSDLKSNPCTNSVYNTLKNTSTMYSVLKNFIGDKPISNMDWDIGILSTANAETSVQANNELINITINKNYIAKASPISLARTMLHEAIHAEIFRKIISANFQIDPNNFPGIWYYWVKYKNGNNDGNDYQHNQMADFYRGKIIAGLKQFDAKRGETHTEFQYQALSWGGLYGTRPWQLLQQTNPTLANQYYNYIQQQQNAGGCP